MTHPLERSIQISNKNVTMKLSKIATLVAAMSVATTFEFFSVAQSAKGVALTGLTGGNNFADRCLNSRSAYHLDRSSPHPLK